MISILADEHIPRSLLRAVEARVVDADLVRLQDVGLRSVDDDFVLEWSADNSRIILTEDKSTLVPRAHDRVANGQAMPGVLVIRPGAESSKLLDDLVMILECSLPDELTNQVIYLPL